MTEFALKEEQGRKALGKKIYIRFSNWKLKKFYNEEKVNCSSKN